MNKFIKASCCIFAALTISSTAIAANYTFTATNGEWDSAGNWSPGSGPPGIGDTATIPAGKTCYIDSGEDIDNIIINAAGGGAGPGVLQIYAGSSLTIHGGTGCAVNGRIEMLTNGGDSIIYLEAPVHFYGDGEIEARRGNGDTGVGRFYGCASLPCSHTLTFGDDGTTAGDIDVIGSIEIERTSLELNSDATLIVDAAADDMTIGPDGYQVALTGTGAVEVSAGELHLDYCSGALEEPAWNVAVTGGALYFESNVGFTSTGLDFTFSNGTMYVNDPVSANELTWTGGTFSVTSSNFIAFVP